MKVFTSLIAVQKSRIPRNYMGIEGGGIQYPSPQNICVAEEHSLDASAVCCTVDMKII